MESWARWYPVDAVGEAAEVARGADVAVVIVGVSSAESLDRPNLELGEEQNAAVRAMVAANPRTVVVVMTPGAVLMPWRDDVRDFGSVSPGRRVGTPLPTCSSATPSRADGSPSPCPPARTISGGARCNTRAWTPPRDTSRS